MNAEQVAAAVRVEGDRAHGRSLVRTSSLGAAAFAVGLAFRVVGVVVLAAVLGPEGQGTVALAALIAILGAGVGSLGLEMALLSSAARPGSRLAARAATWTQTALVAVTAGVILVLAEAFDLLGAALAAGVVAVPGLLFLRLAAACALGEHRRWTFAALTVLPWFLYAICVLALAAGDELTETTALTVFAGSVVCVALASAIPLAFWLRPRIERPWRNVAYRDGVRVFPGLLAQLANYRFDQLVVAAFLARSQLGLYSVAVAGAEVGTLPAQGTASAVVPSASREPTRVGLYRRAALASAALSFLVVPIFVCAVWFGLPEYKESLVPFALLMPGVAAVAASKVLAATLVGLGRAWAASRVALLTLAVTVPLTLILIPLFGIAGAAIASSLAYCMAALLLARIGHTPDRSECRPAEARDVLADG